jgi:hypothetical protein
MRILLANANPACLRVTSRDREGAVLLSRILSEISHETPPACWKSTFFICRAQIHLGPSVAHSVHIPLPKGGSNAGIPKDPVSG